jgi:outer membrane PBP1 activator LpoA protein
LPGPQALIVVASATDARQIVPQLAYVGVFGLPVLATSQVWGGQPASAGADVDLDNVVICDSPWVLNGHTLAGDAGPLAAARSAWPALGQLPPRLVALGADAYTVAARLRLGETVDALPDGLTGALALDADGALRRQVLPCARFAGGVPVLLPPAGTP